MRPGARSKSRERKARLPWELLGASATLDLRLAREDLPDVPALDEVEVVPLEDGRILAAVTIAPHEFEGLTCYLALSKTSEGWRPEKVGLFWGWCCGFGFLTDLQGRVITLPSTEGDPIRCLVDLEGKRAFRRILEIDPMVDSPELRKVLTGFRGAPACR